MAPEVSVVMGVRNGADKLSATIDSVLSQSGVELELVVVNDGSTDGTAALLAEVAARDQRVRVFTQPARGLTAALIFGCANASGEFIARQDAADRSLPGRLVQQAQALRRNANLVLVSCHTRFVGLFGEIASEIAVEADALRRGLNAASLDQLRGPSSHGSVMFRVSAYISVGGYRPHFAVAQDVDLWMRLAEVGEVDVLPEFLYAAEFSPAGITALRRNEQLHFAQLAVDTAAARRGGGDEPKVLKEAIQYPRSMETISGSARWRRAAFLYFLGRCQSQQNVALARRYYRDALRVCPWHWRSAAAFAIDLVRR